jgi:CheY-like chemotaxis protein
VAELAIEIRAPELAAQQGAFGEALATELSARLGRTLRFAPAPLQNVGVLELADSDDALVHQPLSFRDAEGGLHLVMPERDVALLVALEQRADGAALDEASQARLDPAGLAVFSQVVESVVDVASRCFESAKLPALALGEARVVQRPQSDPSWIEDTFYVRLRYAMTVEGFDSGRFDWLVCQRDLVGEAPRGRTVCFVSIGEAERKRITGLEASLGGAAVIVEPHELTKSLDERVVDASVIVIPWEVSGRSGLELAESLARDRRLASAAILLSASRPTRAQVMAALRAGARGVIAHPCDAESIAQFSSPQP